MLISADTTMLTGIAVVLCIVVIMIGTALVAHMIGEVIDDWNEAPHD